MSRTSCAKKRSGGGFTLIEVMGALVIFSLGVLMVLQVSGALGTQIRYAGARSQIGVLAGERLDSLAAQAVSSLAAGTTVDTLSVEDFEFERRVVITPLTAVLAKIDVSLQPLGGSGPSHAVTGYASAPW